MTKNASIVLIVKDDPGAQETISTLLKHQTEINFEIVAVVRATGDLKLTSTDRRVKVVPYTNSKKQITIPEQRNLGIKQSKYSPILFIDASCIPSDGWLDKLYSAYESGEKIVAGFVGVGDAKTRNAFGNYYKSVYIEECPTANVLIDKDVFNAVGYFDESFEYGSDTDFMWRARDNDFMIRYVSDAVVTHEKSDFSKELSRSFRYGKARFQLYYKHRERIKQIPKKDPIVLFYVLFILGLPIAVFIPLYLALLIIPIVKNYKASPLKQIVLNMTFALGVMWKGIRTALK